MLVKQGKAWILIAILAICSTSAFFCSCKGKGTGFTHVAGMLDESRPFEGTYLDEDNHDVGLHITYRQSDGKYDVEIGIFRLTYLDDGVGTANTDSLSFTATDAAGNPIGGIVTLSGDTATVTFTSTTWELIEPGSQFLYVRARQR